MYLVITIVIALPLLSLSSLLQFPKLKGVGSYAKYLEMVMCDLFICLSFQQSERHRFSDRVRIYVRGGTGGQGSSYFGGLGGDGGDVVVQCSSNASLDHFAVKENRRILAEHGTYFS